MRQVEALLLLLHYTSAVEILCEEVVLVSMS